MEQKLEWSKLLCKERERKSTVIPDHRNEFDKDYDKIVYSSSVRRLQDKAQAFPLQENDFTRTRLTHSIEVSALATSLGNAVGQWLKNENEITDVQGQELASLLNVSALIHDLGNPPFGHYGEAVVRNWFKKLFNDNKFNEFNENLNLKLKLTEEQKKDLLAFQGNAQTLRIVSKLQLLNDQYGANFTYGTLSTIMKYPWSSKSGEDKFGYFIPESGIVKRIHVFTGLKDGVRHPATFLLEAADDMAYLCADVEDAVKKGIIPWSEEYNNIKTRLLEENNGIYENMFKSIDEATIIHEANKMPKSKLALIQNFIVIVQGIMFNEVVEEFKKNYSSIMNGTLEHNELLESCKVNGIVRELRLLTEKYCYEDKEVLTLELVGDTVISGLLNIFVEALAKCSEEPESKTREGKLYSLISEDFKYACLFDYEEGKKKKFEDATLYDKLLLVTDFISGMTDSYAVNLYKELLGVTLP